MGWRHLLMLTTANIILTECHTTLSTNISEVTVKLDVQSADLLNGSMQEFCTPFLDNAAKRKILNSLSFWKNTGTDIVHFNYNWQNSNFTESVEQDPIVTSYELFRFFITTEKGLSILRYPSNVEFLSCGLLASAAKTLTIDISVDQPCNLTREDFQLKVRAMTYEMTKNGTFPFTCHYDFNGYTDKKKVWSFSNIFLPSYFQDWFGTRCKDGIGETLVLEPSAVNYIIYFIVIMICGYLPLSAYIIPLSFDSVDIYRQDDVPFGLRRFVLRLLNSARYRDTSITTQGFDTSDAESGNSNWAEDDTSLETESEDDDRPDIKRQSKNDEDWCRKACKTDAIFMTFLNFLIAAICIFVHFESKYYNEDKTRLIRSGLNPYTNIYYTILYPEELNKWHWILFFLSLGAIPLMKSVIIGGEDCAPPNSIVIFNYFCFNSCLFYRIKLPRECQMELHIGPKLNRKKIHVKQKGVQKVSIAARRAIRYIFLFFHKPFWKTVMTGSLFAPQNACESLQRKSKNVGKLCESTNCKLITIATLCFLKIPNLFINFIYIAIKTFFPLVKPLCLMFEKVACPEKQNIKFCLIYPLVIIMILYFAPVWFAVKLVMFDAIVYFAQIPVYTLFVGIPFYPQYGLIWLSAGVTIITYLLKFWLGFLSEYTDLLKIIFDVISELRGQEVIHVSVECFDNVCRQLLPVRRHVSFLCIKIALTILFLTVMFYALLEGGFLTGEIKLSDIMSVAFFSLAPGVFAQAMHTNREVYLKELRKKVKRILSSENDNVSNDSETSDENREKYVCGMSCCKSMKFKGTAAFCCPLECKFLQNDKYEQKRKRNAYSYEVYNLCNDDICDCFYTVREKSAEYQDSETLIESLPTIECCRELVTCKSKTEDDQISEPPSDSDTAQANDEL